jgi:hypothetical protein
MKIVVSILLGLVVLLSQNQSKEGIVNLDLKWGKLGPGMTKEKVRSLLGEGVVRNLIGDCGESYYCDSSKSVTVSMFYYTDCFCWAFEVRSGYFPPQSMSDTERMNIITTGINPQEGFGYSERIHFGDTIELLKIILGNPRHTYNDRGFLFLSYACIADTERSGIAFGFKNNHLQIVHFGLASD